MAIVDLVLRAMPSPALLLLTLLTLHLVSRIVYNLYWHPLAHLQGPRLAAASSLYLHLLTFRGREPSWTERCHRRYGTRVLRVAPNAVSISDGAALHAIYVDGGGFRKDPRYLNFQVEDHATIFSSVDPHYRDVRAKAVLPMVSMARVRQASAPGGLMYRLTDDWIELLRREQQRARADRGVVDILDMAQKLACDVVTGYFFGQPYGALLEHRTALADAAFARDGTPSKLSIAPFLYSIVDFGKFSLLPHALFRACFTLHQQWGRLTADVSVAHAFHAVHQYACRIVPAAPCGHTDTYQHRLLGMGATRAEVAAQCKAVVFAGTDSTAVQLATIMFHLAQNAHVCQRLRAEQAAYAGAPDLQTRPYLRAVVKEGLRLGMANPSRFTRVVPPAGVVVDGQHLPGGCIVGAAPYTLHHNPEVYPEPWCFKPERWLAPADARPDAEPGEEGRARERDFIPFSMGMRACLARNLAQQELLLATTALVESRVLEGARTVKERIELEEYFNAGIKGHHLHIHYP